MLTCCGCIRCAALFCVRQVVEEHLKDKLYDETQIPHWVDRICQDCVKGLVALNKPFKYVGECSAFFVFRPMQRLSISFHVICEHAVSCCIAQKNGAGLHSTYSCFWDAASDNVVAARWPNDKHRDPNAQMQCIVTAFGITF